MVKKKDNEFIRELSEHLGGKLDGVLDTLGLNDMPEEDLMNLLATTLSDPRGVMKSMADQYYSYDAPDYASMIRPVAVPLQPLVGLTEDKLPIVEKMQDVCKQFDADVLNDELKNLFYVQLNQFHENRKEHVLDEERKDEDAWRLGMLLTLYLLEKNKCQGRFEAVYEALHQGVEFYLSCFDMAAEDFMHILIADMGPDFLPVWEEFMNKHGVLFEMKKMVLMGVAHMVTVYPDSLPEVQKWMANIAQSYLKTINHEDVFDGPLLDTLIYCCIHTRSVDAKNAILTLYGKHAIPAIMVDGGVNEVRKTIKKATLGIELGDTLDEFMMSEEEYVMGKGDEDDCFDEDGDEENYWDGVDDEEDDDEEEWEDDEEYEPLGRLFDLSDKPVNPDHMKDAKTLEKYTLRISLRGIKPEIWREIEVPSSLRLTVLAVHIQNVMGWEFEHMHNIQKGNKYYCTTSMEYADGDLDGSKYSVKDLLKKVGDSLLFTYDFGDSWEHTVELVKKGEYEQGEKLKMHFVDGARNCPPEDCGGVWGYQDLCEAMKRPNSKQAREFIEWLGGIYAPEDFPKKKTASV